LGKRPHGVHEARGYATWVSHGKHFRLDHLNVYDSTYALARRAKALLLRSSEK
jgi:hypothetical protein